MRYLIYIKFIFAFFVLSNYVHAQNQTPLHYSFQATINSAPASLPFSNSITDIEIQGDTIWLGTGKGLSRSADGGQIWKNYFRTSPFGEEDISAIAVKGKEIWVATAHSVERDGQSLPEGSGIKYSSDGGESWQSNPQPVDVNNVDTLYWNSKSLIRALGITTAINNITYDIAVTDSTVWICSFAGMARKSNDKGKTWQRVILPPDKLNSISPNDSLVFDLSPSGGALGLQNNLNHRAFSVFAENDSTIWIGSAGGINKSTDRGKSWIKFTHQNESSPISGNFVVSIGKQTSGTKNIIWAATITAEDASEKRGVSFSTDGGITWSQTLLGEFAHNLGFKNNIAYAATDNGIFRSSDFGASWMQTGTIYDKSLKQRYTQTGFFTIAAQADTIWCGGSDGIAKTIDNATSLFGSSWTILHASQPLSSSGDVYAYPNPFSPNNEVIRIHYSTNGNDAQVTIRVFDFGMNLVRTVIQNVPRDGAREHDEMWDGKNDNTKLVPNGVYFYQVIVGNNEPRWGKILVIK
ncbi:MAG: hypothetical protein PHP42_03525 [Bacteroidota bacterium]|nr:hypothetical protein [Bacteroidota bacterium]